MRALYLLLGDPVAHSRSPAIHARAFQALGIDAVYAPCRVTDVPASVRALRALGVAGANVTIPHKQAVIPSLDRLDPAAERIGAVNCIANRDGVLHGYNTDREGVLRALGPFSGRALAQADLVVNCTSVGMSGEETPVDPALIRSTVIDLAYSARGDTALIRAVRARGLRTIDGIEVLVQQAIASLEIWLGKQPLSALAPELRKAALA